MGMGQSGTMHGLIYSNDGSGNFTLFQELQGASDGFSHFVDVNNDNLQDLIVYGLIGSSNPFNGLYINSNGTLILDEDFPEFTAVRGSISASDIDNDNDVDLFISGFPESKLLLNNGDGSFAVDSTSVATTLNSSSLIFDVDGDNDLDIYIAGFTTQQGVFNQQYTNLGNATFIESNNSTFEPTSEGKLAQVDIDSDDDLDVFIIGRNPENEKVAKLYINEGFGQYTEAFSDTFEGVTNGSLGFGDIDGDLDIDIIISGVNDNFEFVTNIYLNQKLDIVSTSESSSIESEIAFFESRINRSQIEIQISQRLEGETIFTLLNIEGIEFQ